MPPNNASNAPTQQPNANKRINRVAIPLPLSRPRPAPRPEANAEAGAERPEKTQVRSQQEARDAPTVVAGTSHEAVQLVAATGIDGDVGGEVSKEQEKVETPPVEIQSAAATTSSSNGLTPDSAAQSTPASGSITSVPVQNGASSRKPTLIRTELPPAFVPAAPHVHPSRQSTSNIVFGGEDSSTSSPGPPHSAGSGYMPPRPHPPPFYPSAAHAHHFSETQAGQMYPGHMQQPAPWNMPRQYYPGQQSQHVYHPQAPLHMQQQTNGHASQSGSNSPGSSATTDSTKVGQELRSPPGFDTADAPRAAYHDTRAATNGLSGMRQHTFARPSQPFQGPPPDFRAELDNAQAMRDHVRSHFADPMLADCHLQVTVDLDGSRQYIDGHKLVLARSPMMLELIRSSEPPVSASLKTQVYVRLTGRYMGLKAFNEALRYVYGGPLLPFEQHARALSIEGEMAPNEERMIHVLQYIAAGAWLKLPVIATRGVEVASSLLHWDTIVTALEFALEGGLSQAWTVPDGSENSTPLTNGVVAAPTYDPFSTHLLHNVLNFTVNMFPPNFYPDTSAPQLVCSPRLPSLPPTHESRPSRSDPRLSKIRFGELPLDDSTKPSVVTTTISSLLFSLPFPLLKYMLEHPTMVDRLGMETVGSILRQVVVEREARRTKVLKAVRPAVEPSKSGLVNNLYWVETVEPSTQHRAGCRLARRRIVEQSVPT